MKPCSKLFLRRFVFVLVGFCCLNSHGAEDSQKGKTDALPLYELDTPALTQKAQEGDAEAQYWLGSRYYLGSDGVRQDYTQATDWLQKSVDQKNARAQSLLGYMYVTGSGVPVDSEKGLKLVQCAAAQTNQTALYELGTFYEMGRSGLVPDRFEAMNWYIKAAAQGHAAAKKSLSKLRQEADAFRLGTASNEWWEISLDELVFLAETGDSDWQRRLGTRYRGYGGTPIDLEKAQYWLEQSAAQTNLSAHYNLALLYTATTNVQPEKAFYHCSIAAEGDHQDAQNTLGRYFRDGVGTEPDRAKALYWYRKAEQSGHSSAPENIYNLMKGRVVEYPSLDKSTIAEEYTPPPVKLSIRDFNDQDVAVDLVEYDSENKLVTISPGFGSVDTFPLSAFSKKSWAVIQNGMLFKAFEKLNVQFQQEKMSRAECEQKGRIFGRKGSSEFKYDGFVYSLKLNNREKLQLNNLKVECEFFYKMTKKHTGMLGDGVWKEQRDMEYCELKNISIDAGEKSVAQTPPFILESYDTDSGVYYSDGSPTVVKSDPEGLMVRVTCPMMDGSTVYRDFYEKPSLRSQVSWQKKEAIGPSTTQKTPPEKKKSPTQSKYDRDAERRAELRERGMSEEEIDRYFERRDEAYKRRKVRE